MQLNQATDYAFRVVLHLASLPPRAIVNGQSIAEKQNIPARFLQKIMRSLSRAGLVKSYRGIEGGFELIRLPEQITLHDVIVAMEGPINIQRCLGDRNCCTRTKTDCCPVHNAIAGIQSQFVAALQYVNFAKLTEEHCQIQKEGEKQNE